MWCGPAHGSLPWSCSESCHGPCWKRVMKSQPLTRRFFFFFKGPPAVILSFMPAVQRLCCSAPGGLASPAQTWGENEAEASGCNVHPPLTAHCGVKWVPKGWLSRVRKSPGQQKQSEDLWVLRNGLRLAPLAPSESLRGD